MAYLDGKVRAGRDRQKQALIAEAGKAGAQIHEIVELDGGPASSGAVVGGAFKAMFGGRMQVDGIHLFRLSTNGWGHAYVQPFSGFAPLPGEHYGVVNGSLASPAIARADLRYSDYPFDPAVGPEVAQHLAASPAMKAVLRDLVWNWPSGMAKIELDWAMQLRSVGDGTTQVVMQAGRYGGLTTYEVGFGLWQRLCGAVHSCLAQGAWPAQYFPVPPRYADVLGGQAQTPAPVASEPAVSVQIDYGPLIGAALTAHLGKKVWLGEGPAKKMANIRKHVVPAQLGGVPLLAGIDLTTFGSAKDAIVVTSTQLVAKEFDDVLVVELASVRAVPAGQSPSAGAVEVVVDRLGTVRVPVGIDFAPVHDLLAAVARANSGVAGPVHAEVSAFVGDAPGRVSMAEAQQLAGQAQAAMQTGSVDDKINAAAQLLLGGQYQASIDAYLQIAQQHPERTGTCYGQIGAGLFFIEQYARAIQYYEAAKQHGADPRMMDENIAEARGYL